MKPENGCRGRSSLASSVTNNGHWIWSLIPRPTESTLPQQGENPLWDYLVDLLQQPEFKSQLICLRKLEFSRNPKNYPKSCCEVVFVYTNFRSCSAWKQMDVSMLLCPSNLVTFGINMWNMRNSQKWIPHSNLKRPTSSFWIMTKRLEERLTIRQKGKCHSWSQHWDIQTKPSSREPRGEEQPRRDISMSRWMCALRRGWAWEKWITQPQGSSQRSKELPWGQQIGGPSLQVVQNLISLPGIGVDQTS